MEDPYAKNIEEPEISRKAQKAPSGIFALIEKGVKFNVFEEGLPVKYLPYILFSAALAILYIGNAHYSEKLDKNYQKMKQELEGLKANYNTLKADYMHDSKQSEVEKRIKPKGIQNSKKPLIWIQENKNEY